MERMYSFVNWFIPVYESHVGFGRARMRKAITGEQPHTGEREKARRLKQMKKDKLDVQ